MNAIKDSDVFMSLILVFSPMAHIDVIMSLFFLFFLFFFNSCYFVVKDVGHVEGGMETAGPDDDPAEHLRNVTVLH